MHIIAIQYNRYVSWHTLHALKLIWFIMLFVDVTIISATSQHSCIAVIWSDVTVVDCSYGQLIALMLQLAGSHWYVNFLRNWCNFSGVLRSFQETYHNVVHEEEIEQRLHKWLPIDHKKLHHDTLLVSLCKRMMQ